MNPYQSQQQDSGLVVGRAIPSGKMPQKETLEYLKLGLELLLLLLAVPYLIKQLFTHPGRLSKAAARKHVGS